MTAELWNRRSVLKSCAISTNQTLEGEFPDEELSALLVSPDFTESDGSWPVSVWLLDTTGGWCALTSGLCGQLLPWGLASSRFTCWSAWYEPSFFFNVLESNE